MECSGMMRKLTNGFVNGPHRFHMLRLSPRYRYHCRLTYYLATVKGPPPLRYYAPAISAYELGRRQLR